MEATIFKQIAENNWDPIVFANLEGIIIYVNQAACEMYGYSKNELIGESVDVFNSQETHDTQEIISAIIENGGWSGKIIQRKKGNSTFNALLTISLVYDKNNKPIGYSSNSKDISNQIQEQKTIENALRDKDILFQEIHHRLKNNLAIISSILELKASQSGDEKFIEAIKDAQRRIKATAVVHEVLYGQDSLRSIGMSDYISNLLENILSSFEGDTQQISIYVRCTGITLDINFAIPIGLIFNELMTNAYKHAFPDNRKGVINISLIKKNDLVEFTFNDDGVGLPANFNVEESPSTGMIVLNSLVEQMEGELTVTNGNGAHFCVKFNAK